MVQTLTRTPSPARNFNADLIRREIREQFPAKMQDLNLGGYEVDETLFTTGSTIVGRIVKPRAAAFVVTQTLTTTDTYQPGELRCVFDPDLTAPQITTFDGLLTAHDETDTNPKQTAEDLDVTTLDDIETFDAGTAWNTRTNVEQNAHMDDMNRMVLRIWKRLEAAE